MLDEKGRLFGKISVVDIGIILVIVLAVAMLGVKIIGSGNSKFNAEGQQDCAYTVTVKNVRQETVDAIEKSIGSSVYDVQNEALNTNIGTLEGITEIKPYMGTIYLDNGTAIKSEIPGRYEVTFEVSATASKASQSVLISGKKEVSKGSSITLATKYTLNEGRIANITFAE